MSDRFARTKILYGGDFFEKISSARVFVCGVGAVGGYAVEALARSGVGNFVLIDFDTVDITNINRQICALESTVGRKKVDVMKDRILDINPSAKIEVIDVFLDEKNIPQIFLDENAVIVDAIDSLSSKISLLEYALSKSFKIVSSMGAARKKDVSKIETGKLFKTYNCNLAAKIRKELRKRGIKKSCECVFSSELAEDETHIQSGGAEGKKVIGSSPIITGIFGLKLADLAIKEILDA